MYYVTGANIFGQWPWEDLYTNEFRALKAKLDTEAEDTYSAYSTKARLIQINWAYNILQIDDVFYIIGAWKGQDNQLCKLPIPEECSGKNMTLAIIGNDYNVLLIEKNINRLWIIDLKHEKGYKTLNFNIEMPTNSLKRLKTESRLAKVELRNESCVYLTSEGCVYGGILPSLVDTAHCSGNVIDVQCGFEHFVLLTDIGVVYTWGSGRRLQLGHNDVSSIDVPTEVEALGGIKIVKICTGGWHTLALSESGDLYAWGWNNIGQLGIKDLNKECTASYSVPTLVELFDGEGKEVIKNVKDIVCGSRHSAILLEDNSVWTTGFNKYGQLGLSPESYPTVNYFKKVFQCKNNVCQLIGGPWNTVIECD